MGPLVTAASRDRVAGFVDAGEAAGATLVVDGRNPATDADGEGFFVGPTLFDHVTTDVSIYTEEIFGPITNDGGAARRFQNEVEVGMIGINLGFPQNA